MGHQDSLVGGVLAAKLDDLSSVFGVHRMEGENWHLQVILWSAPLHCETVTPFLKEWKNESIDQSINQCNC